MSNDIRVKLDMVAREAVQEVDKVRAALADVTTGTEGVSGAGKVICLLYTSPSPRD